nr:hypothetical protein [Amycolatopsis azurea]
MAIERGGIDVVQELLIEGDLGVVLQEEAGGESVYVEHGLIDFVPEDREVVAAVEGVVAGGYDTDTAVRQLRRELEMEQLLVHDRRVVERRAESVFVNIEGEGGA